MGKRKGCRVDASSLMGGVSGLVIISMVPSSVEGSMVVGSAAVVEVSVGVMVSMVMLVSTGEG